MNNKTLFVLLLSGVTMGCVPMVPLTCEPYTGPTPPCTGDPNAPQVNLNTNSLNATPYCVKAKKGTFIVFRLTPHDKNDLGSVEIFPKNAADTWLAGTNDPFKDLIIVGVPATLEPGTHDFGIKTSDKCVDPRVAVEN